MTYFGANFGFLLANNNSDDNYYVFMPEWSATNYAQNLSLMSKRKTRL